MAAPSVSGITTVTALAPTAPILASWGGFTVRAAGSLTASGGYSQIQDSTASANQLVGGGTTFTTPLNHSNRGRFLAIRYQNSTSTGIGGFVVDRVFVLHSDLTGNNYRSFPLAENNNQLSDNLLKIVNAGNGLVTKYADVGTFDPTNVARIEFLFPKANNTTTFSQRYRYSLVNPITVVGGEVGNKASFQNIYNYALANTDLLTESVVGLRNDVARHIAFSMQIGDGSSALDFEATTQETIVFRPPYKTTVAIFDTWYPANAIGLEFRTTTGNTIVVINKSFKGEVGYYVDFNGNGNITGYNLLFSEAGDISFNMPNANIVASFQNCSPVVTNQGTYNFSISSADSVGLRPTANTNFTGTIQRCPIGIEITAAGNYANTIATVKNNTTYDVRITTGVTSGQTVNLDGIDFASGSTTPTHIYWAGTTGSITVTVNRGGLNTSSAGGTINLVEPTAQIAISGIPEVANAIVAVENLSTSVITYPSITSGAAIIPTAPGVDYKIMVDAPGYLRTAVVLDGATPEYAFSLTSYRDIYDAGVSQAANISFDYGTFEVTISDGLSSYSFADVFRTIEDYLSTSLGVLFDFPPYPVIVDLDNTYSEQYLIFPYDTELDQANPVRVKPDPTNTTDPELADFVTVLEGAADRQFGIFDFSEAGGRIIRFHSKSVVVSGGSSGGDATLANQTTIIDHLAGIKGATWNSSTDSLEAIRDRGDASWTTATSVTVSDKTGFSLSSAGIQAIWEYSDRLLTGFGTLIADIVTAVWNAGTRALTDKAGFSLTSGERTAIATATEAALINEGDGQQLIDAIIQAIEADLDVTELELGTIAAAVWTYSAGDRALSGTQATTLAAIPTFPANFSALQINATGHIGRVTLVDTTNTNSDMRGTNNALLATNYTPPDNASIADILEDTGTTIPGILSAIQGAGFNTSTDSLEAIRDRGDLEWLTATGFSTLTQSDIRSAVGLVSANLDAQLATIGTDVDSALADTTALIVKIDTLLARLTAARAGYLDKLNVSGTLAHSDAAAIYKADVAPLLTAIGQIPTNPLLAEDYVAPDNVAIADIQKVVRADEYPEVDQWIKKEAGTDTVLFAKNISRDDDGKVISLTEAP